MVQVHRCVSLGQPGRELAINGFTFSATHHTAGLVLPPHAHEHANFVLVLNGAFREGWGRVEEECAPGALLFKRPCQRHENRFGPGGARSFFVELAPAEFAAIRTETAALERTRHLAAPPCVRLALRMYREYLLDDDASRLALPELAYELVGELARELRRTTGQEPPRWLRLARQWLHEGYQAPLRFDVMARDLDVHPVHLAREFRRRFGCTAGEYVRRLRVDEACRLLSESDEPLARIATLTGFADQAHFCRVFKHQTQRTPRAFRAGVGRPAPGEC
jgi:AraC family transcriptional regulator